MMNISPLALSLLLQFAPESAVGNPPVVLYDAAVADPFPARPVPPAWRVRRAVSVAPEPPPLPGRSVPERLDTLEDSVGNLLIAQSPLWHPGPRVRLASAAAPSAERGEVGKANTGMPPPDTAERGEVLDRLQAIESKVGTILTKLEGLLRSTATAPPVGAAPPARPAAMPPSGVPAVHVLADRYGRQWDDSVSGYDGLVRWVEQQNTAVPSYPNVGYNINAGNGIYENFRVMPQLFPVSSMGGFSAGSVCGPGGCGPSGFGRGLLGGLFR